MHILQIHFGEISAERAACIASVKRDYADCSYELVTDAEKCIAEIMDFLKLTERPRRFDPSNLKGKVVISDWYKFVRGVQDGDMLGIDTDAMSLKRIDFPFVDNGKPYLLEMSPEQSDIAVLYANHSRALLDRLNDFASHNAFNVLYGPMDCNVIPEEYIRHIGPSSTTEEHWQKNNCNW